MPVDSERFLTRWHAIVASRDLEALAEVLAPEVSIGSPPYWAPLEGKPLVHFLLGVILETIEDFTYHREWTAGSELALEFRGHVGGIELQGIDLITLDDTGRVTHLDVLIRPMNALEQLRDRVTPRMTEYLDGAGRS